MLPRIVTIYVKIEIPYCIVIGSLEGKKKQNFLIAAYLLLHSIQKHQVKSYIDYTKLQ